jgi:hypothetical protein
MRGAKYAGKIAGKSALRAGAAGALWARDHGSELLDQIPVERIESEVRDTVGTARDRIDGFVRNELRDLRRALRQQRKRLGV